MIARLKKTAIRHLGRKAKLPVVGVGEKKKKKRGLLEKTVTGRITFSGM